MVWLEAEQAAHGVRAAFFLRRFEQLGHEIPEAARIATRLVPVDVAMGTEPLEVEFDAGRGHPRKLLHEAHVAATVARHVVLFRVGRVVVNLHVQDAGIEADLLGQVPVVVKLVLVRHREQLVVGHPDVGLVERFSVIEQPGGLGLLEQPIDLLGLAADGQAELLTGVVLVGAAVGLPLGPKPAYDVINEGAQPDTVLLSQAAKKAHTGPQGAVLALDDGNIRVVLLLAPLSIVYSHVVELWFHAPEEPKTV